MSGYQGAGLWRDLGNFYARPSSILLFELREFRLFRKTVFHDGQKLGVHRFCHNRKTSDLIVLFLKLDCANARGRAAHRADLLFIKANRLPLARRKYDLISATREPCPFELIALLERDRDDAVTPDVLKILKRRLLDNAIFGDKHQIFVAFVLHRIIHHSAHTFICRQFKKILDRPSLGGPRRRRYLVDLRLEHAAAIREEQHIVMRRGTEKMQQEILVGNVGSNEPFAAAALNLKGVRREALDITARLKP